MPLDEMLVLACSKKWGGRCVAGISKRTGGWVRPVSRGPHGELTPYHYRIDGRDIEPLDVVRLEHGENLGDPTQPENVEVGATRWQLLGEVGSAKAGGVLARHLTDGPRLLGNRGSAVPEDEAMRGVEASLALVRTESLELRLEAPREGASRPRPRAGFDLAGQRYDLALTDYLVAPRLTRAGLGAHVPGDLGLPVNADVHLTVSLAEAREGWCTKLVAAVLFLPEAG
jgi:hypothetical protein